MQPNGVRKLKTAKRIALYTRTLCILTRSKTMSKERTLSIIKPDAVSKSLIGEINRRFEQAGLRIVGAKMLHLSKDQAGNFYAVHKERPFYSDLVSFMSSGPVLVQVL